MQIRRTDRQTMCTVALGGQHSSFCNLIIFLCVLLNKCHVRSWLKEALWFFLECSAFQPLYLVNIGRNRKRTRPASRQNLNETKIKLHEGNRQSAFDPPFKGTYGDCSVSRVNQLILQSSVCKNATICTGF